MGSRRNDGWNGRGKSGQQMIVRIRLMEETLISAAVLSHMTEGDQFHQIMHVRAGVDYLLGGKMGLFCLHISAVFWAFLRSSFEECSSIVAFLYREYQAGRQLPEAMI